MEIILGVVIGVAVFFIFDVFLNVVKNIKSLNRRRKKKLAHLEKEFDKFRIK